MKFQQMYKDIMCNDIITLAGRPGIGKTETALKIADKYINETHSKVLYIAGDAFEYIHYPSWKMRANNFPLEIQNNFILWNEIYKYRTEFYLVQKTKDFLEKNKDVGLVIFDDDRLFDLSINFVEDCSFWITQQNGAKVIFLAHIDRKSEKRRKCMPKLKDISKTLTEKSNIVFAIYRESYYLYEKDLNASSETTFIRLQ